MSRFFVESVRHDTTKENICYGPVEDLIISVRFRKDDGPSKWLTLVRGDEIDIGLPIYFLENDDRFERHLFHWEYEGGIDDDNEDRELKRNIIDVFEGISLDTDADTGRWDYVDYSFYFNIYEQILREGRNNPADRFMKYIVALFSSDDEDERDELAKLAEGKYIDEVEIPECKAELKFRERNPQF